MTLVECLSQLRPYITVRIEQEKTAWTSTSLARSYVKDITDNFDFLSGYGNKEVTRIFPINNTTVLIYLKGDKNYENL